MRWRDVSAHASLLLGVSCLVVVALATRFPEARLIERAEQWPVVGSVAREFRSRYLGGIEPVAKTAPTAPKTPIASIVDQKTGDSLGPVVDVVQVIDSDFVGFKPKVWVPAGTPVYESKDVRGRVLTEVDRLFPLSLLDRQGDWFQVRIGNIYAGMSKGWVRLENYREPTPEELSAPAPLLPLPAVEPSVETVAAARKRMLDGGTKSRCGPYTLWSDVREGLVLDACKRACSAVEQAYRERYGLEPISGPAETLFLFSSPVAYLPFRQLQAPDVKESAFAFPSRGYVAVQVLGRSPEATASTVTHELTHLLNRRSVGPALPPWFDEGMARDLADRGMMRYEPRGDRDPAGPRGAAAPRPSREPLISLKQLVELDQEAFYRQARENYEAAAVWIEFFVDGPSMQLKDGFERFLKSVAAGERISAELLLDSLGTRWEELDAGMAAWRVERTKTREARFNR